MSEPLPADCCSCGRFEEASGRALRVEDAVDGEGRARAYHYLRDLQGARRKSKRDRYAELLYRLDIYAHTGTLDVPRELNHLVDEIWEVKTSQDRLPFYKTPHGNQAQAVAVRLTHGFEKDKGRTREGRIPRKHLDLASWVAREDKKRVS